MICHIISYMLIRFILNQYIFEYKIFDSIFIASLDVFRRLPYDDGKNDKCQKL